MLKALTKTYATKMAAAGHAIVLPCKPATASKFLRLDSARFGILAKCDEIAMPLLEPVFKDTPGFATACGYPSDGAMSPLALCMLREMLLTHKPRVVLEHGAGVSTILIAAYARFATKHLGFTPHLYTIEHSKEWVSTSMDRLSCFQLESYATVIHAPIAPHRINGIDYRTYDANTVARLVPGNSVDFAFFDGPPACTEGDPGRSGCLPLSVPLLRNGAKVVLDDAYRQGEKLAVDHWMSIFPRSVTRVATWLTSRGQAVLEWKI